MVNHMYFSRTGKTSVARLYGRMLKEFGFLSDGDLIEVKPSDLKGVAVGEAGSFTSAILEKAKGKVLFIDEAYGLDPSRRAGNSHGGEVIDTLVEKLDRSGGADIAVILAGYTPQMKELFKNASNSGFASRFNYEDAFEFDDFNDDEIKLVLLSLIRREGFVAEVETIKQAVSLISQRRRLDGFANAAEASLILNRAKLKLANRKQVAGEAKKRWERSQLESAGNSSPSKPGRNNKKPVQDASSAAPKDVVPLLSECVCDPYELIASDFIGEETSAEKARDALSDLENVEHVLDYLQELEDTVCDVKLCLQPRLAD